MEDVSGDVYSTRTQCFHRILKKKKADLTLNKTKKGKCFKKMSSAYKSREECTHSKFHHKWGDWDIVLEMKPESKEKRLQEKSFKETMETLNFQCLKGFEGGHSRFSAGVPRLGLQQKNLFKNCMKKQ